MLQHLFLMVALVLGCLPSKADFRFPAVSGQFYPASPLPLKSDIERYLSNVPEAKQPQDQKLIGMIVPHAGYQYSGQTAAFAYAYLKNYPVDVVVLIGPYHENNFPGVAIWAEGTWRTPLGEVVIDESLAKGIRGESQDFFYDAHIHTLEHSIEVQLPFIQVVAAGTKIVPILISDMRYAKALADALHKHLQGRSVYVIASTDLSHYHPDSTARSIDQKTQKSFQDLSPDAFRQAYKKGEIELCGAAAVLTLLELSQLYTNSEIVNLHYANSGDQSQDKNSVVGYNSSLLILSQKIPEQQGKLLLNLARDTLRAHLSHQTVPLFQVVDPILQQKRAVFVTLRDKLGNLKGCIGRVVAEEQLYKAVQNMSIEAATKDSRFPPISLKELDGLSLEISVLDPPVDVRSAQEIIFGTHGVIVSQGSKSGIFLPEVAQEFATKEKFLSELCHQKADLPGNCWQNPQTRIQVFTTQTIAEKK